MKLGSTKCFRQSFVQCQYIRKMFKNNEISNVKALSADFQDMLSEAVHCLKKGSVIAVPTDTVYGITGLAQNTLAVNNIYNIKNRSEHKPIAICVSKIEDIPLWGKVTISWPLLQELLPGPVTLVFERTSDLNPQLNPEHSKIGIRIPQHSFVQALCESCAEPLALTSANASNAQSTLTVKEFYSLWPKLDLIVDGGQLSKDSNSRLGSTVVDLSLKGYYKIIRPGSAYQQTVDILVKAGLQETLKNGKVHTLISQVQN